MWMRTLALIALAPALAIAKTSVIAKDARAREPSKTDDAVATQLVIGQVTGDIAIDKLRVVIADRDDARTVRLVITLSTASTERRQAVMPLALPHGARVRGAAVAIGNEARIEATAFTPEQAREEYQNLFRVAKDPLLVELVDPARDLHAIASDAYETAERRQFDPFMPVPDNATWDAGFLNYVVRAFPLTNRDNARVEVMIELPDDATRLAITHAQRIGIVEVERRSGSGTLEIRRRRDVGAAIAMDLPAVQRMPIGVAKLVERTHVDATHSLYAGFAPVITRGPVPPVSIDGPHTPVRFHSVDKTIIRRKVKQHMAQLARCYTKVTEYRGGQEGTAVMHFFIEENGGVSASIVDGEIDDPRITDCLADQVRQWEFPRGDTGVMVNYPLTFQLAR